jgi:hypothetical protein
LNWRRQIQIIMLALGTAGLVGACSSAVSRKPSQTSSSAGQADKLPDVWRSLTTGKEYFVRTDKSHFYAQWVNLPPAAAHHGAYIHTACKLVGSKWAGTSNIYMPCAVGEGKEQRIANTCHLTLEIEIDSVSKDRITGRGQTLKKFDCGACKVTETGWANFEWVPAQ